MLVVFILTDVVRNRHRDLAEHYRSIGVQDVTFRSYPGARHELFNELERDEVRADVLAWLASRT